MVMLCLRVPPSEAQFDGNILRSSDGVNCSLVQPLRSPSTTFCSIDILVGCLGSPGTTFIVNCQRPPAGTPAFWASEHESKQ